AGGGGVGAVVGTGAGAHEVAAGAADVDARGESARGVGDDDIGRAAQPQVASAAGCPDDHGGGDGEQVSQGDFAQCRRGVGAGLGVQVDADEVVRGEAAGAAVAGGGGRGGERAADAAGSGGGVVDPVREACGG